MNPITYKRNYTHSVKYHVDNSTLLEEKLSAYVHAVEFFKEGVDTYMYFDIDIKMRPDIHPSEFIQYDQKALQVAKNIINNVLDVNIKSVCTSSLCNYIEGKNKERISKISFHIVCHASTSREEAKKCAEKCNSYLARQIRQDIVNLSFMANCFDLNVYHKVQCWRLVGQIKIGDPATKKKKIIEGTFHDSIVQISEQENNLRPLQMLYKRGIALVANSDSSECFSVLYEVLQDTNKTLILKQKMQDFSTWIQLAMFISYHIQTSEVLNNEGRELFLRCSSLCEDKYDVHDCEKKLNELIGKCRVNNENQIKSWFNGISDIWADIDEYSPIIDELLQEYDDSLNQTEHNFIDYDFLPCTETQYVVLQYASTVTLQKFWKQQFTTVQHLSKIRILLLDIKDDFLVKKYFELGKELLDNLQEKYLPFEYGDSKDCDAKIIKYFAFICNIEVSTEEIQKLLAYLPNQEDTKKVSIDTRYIVKELEPGLVERLQLQCPFHYGDGYSDYQPLPKMGQRECGPFEYILKLSQEPQLWSLRIPYKKQLEFIWDISKDDVEYFRFVLCRYSDLFVAEKFFGFICRAYDDRQAAKILLDIYPFWTISPSHDLYVYDDSTGLWSLDSFVQQRVIFMCSSFLYTGGKEKFSYGGFVESAKKAVKSLQSLSLSKTYDFKTLQHTSIGKLLFPNGYWDGTKDQFHCCRYLPDNTLLFTFPKVFFFARIPDNYINRWDEYGLEQIADMKNRLFYQMHDRHIAEYHIESLSCALLGVKHKGFYVHIGDTNSGKSTEKSMIEATFGEYVGTGNTDDFAIIKDDKREASISNSFAYYNWMKRLLLYSEKSERKLNTEMLKTHASGQEDQVCTRIQYKPAILVNVHYTMIFYMNEAFEVTKPNDPAYIERAFFYYWNKVFMAKEKITDPTTQIEMDSTITNWKNDPVRRQMFCAIILNGFRDFIGRGSVRLPIPPEIKQSTQEEVGTVETTKELMEKILYGFVLDGNPDVILERESMVEKCKELNVCPKRVGLKLNYIMKTLGQKTIHPVQRRINGVKQNCWVGIYVRNSNNLSVKEGDYLTDFEQWQKLMQLHNGIIPTETKRILMNVAEWYNKINLSIDECEAIETYGTAYQLKIYEEKRNAKRARHQL